MSAGIWIDNEWINGCELQVSDLKRLLEYPKGVLIFKENMLLFVSYKDMKVKSFECEQEAITPIVFVSDNFDKIIKKIKIINNDNKIILEFSGDELILRNPISGDELIYVRGKRY